MAQVLNEVAGLTIGRVECEAQRIRISINLPDYVGPHNEILQPAQPTEGQLLAAKILNGDVVLAEKSEEVTVGDARKAVTDARKALTEAECAAVDAKATEQRRTACKQQDCGHSHEAAQ